MSKKSCIKIIICYILSVSGIVNSTGNLPIYNNIEINNQVKQLTVYIWIDGSIVNNENSNDILSSVYKENISMSIESGDK